MNVRGLLFLLLSLSLTFSSPLSDFMPAGAETSPTNPLIEIIFDYAIPFALIISYTIVALGFMAAKVFNSRTIESWAKLELREVLISTMYAALIISFFPVFNSLVEDFSKSNNGLTTKQMFIQVIDSSFEPLKGTILKLFTFATLGWIGWNPAGVIGIPFYPNNLVDLEYSHFFDPKSYLNIFALFAHTFIPILFAAMVSIMGQIVLLNFFEEVIFVFIGLGLAMRSFTFTRKMGGTFLAVVLGIFFLFKLLLVIEASVYLNLGLDGEIQLEGGSAFQFLDIISEGISILLSGITQLFECINLPIYVYQFIVDCADGNPLAYVVCFFIAPIIWLFDLILAVIQVVVGIIFWVVALISVMLMGVVTLTDVANTIIIQSIAKYSDVITFAFFMPILNFIIIVAGIRSLTETFGGDISVVNMLTFI